MSGWGGEPGDAGERDYDVAGCLAVVAVVVAGAVWVAGRVAGWW
jgi:hypothetical protein